MIQMDVFEAIKTRRSVRAFTNENVGEEILIKILDAGRWAPSGINNQAWRFIVVRSRDTVQKLSELTIYGKTMLSAPLLIVVFLDKEHMYDHTKDVQSIGACIQNMLLAIHSMGLGAVWLGEISKNKEAVNKIMEAPESYELMAVIAFGYPAKKARISDRKDLDQIVFREKFGVKL
jgi:nitroreductase